jgi:hypothetical protein
LLGIDDGLESYMQFVISCEGFVQFELSLGFIVFNTTFNNISVVSWWSVLLVEAAGE